MGTDHAGHTHEAPHGGLLVELGEEEFAHVELLLEPEDGALTAWILDGHVERAVRSAQASLDVELYCEGAELSLSLLPVASALTGETVGDTSEFHVADERLGSRPELEGRILHVEALGSVFEAVAFEDRHGH